MVLITVRLPAGLSLPDGMRHLGLADEDVDLAFGLIAVDSAKGLYALRVSDESARRLGWGAGGPYADPKIEPFGPPS
ncbi:hypothetical protein [Sinosporangium siamense]|uniref:Uncharacterized protein n=1 Tax=Sinosporangium siamense TaxID=1367973 RepID=A0A919RKU7_9ACTN|nr:hypothetical protein [Sinosporangium siamense]GII93774.1 hypothetical protein Ssi02_40050 [Sinosporangium siamense]